MSCLVLSLSLSLSFLGGGCGWVCTFFILFLFSLFFICLCNCWRRELVVILCKGQGMILVRSGLYSIVLPLSGSLFLHCFFFFLGLWIGVVILVSDCALAYLIFPTLSPLPAPSNRWLKTALKWKKKKKKMQTGTLKWGVVFVFVFCLVLFFQRLIFVNFDVFTIHVSKNCYKKMKKKKKLSDLKQLVAVGVNQFYFSVLLVSH